MDVSSTHNVVFVPNSNKVKAIQLNTGKHIKTFNGHFKYVSGMFYSDPFQVILHEFSLLEILEILSFMVDPKIQNFIKLCFTIEQNLKICRTQIYS